MTQARRAVLGRAVMATMLKVPLMMAALAVVVGSHIVGVGQELGSLLIVVPLHAAFLANDGAAGPARGKTS